MDMAALAHSAVGARGCSCHCCE